MLFGNISAEDNRYFVSAANRIKTNLRPTLIIGLGGTGAEAVLRAKKVISERAKSTEESVHKPDNVEYLVIDTDLAAEKMSFEGVTLEKKYGEFLLIRNADLVHIIEKIRSTSDVSDNCPKNELYSNIKEWLSDDIPESRIVNGAAGIRQAGRLILHLNIIKVMNAINDKLNKISLGQALSEVELDVYIMFGVGGGTGGGTFIDVSYLVRKLIYDKGGNPNINGIVFLPDVTLAKHGIDLITKNNVKLNGYAALLDLDCFMEVDRRTISGQAIQNKQKYGNILTVKWDKNIFERCFLFGASDESRRLSYPPDEMALATAAEAIWAIIADDNAGFNVNSFFSNTIPHVDDFNNNSTETDDESKLICYKSHKYTTVGACSYIFPYNEITTYLLHLLAKEIEKEPSPLSDNMFIKKTKLSKNMLKKVLSGKENFGDETVDQLNCNKYEKVIWYCEYAFSRNSKVMGEEYGKIGPIHLYEKLAAVERNCEKSLKDSSWDTFTPHINGLNESLRISQKNAALLKSSLKKKDIIVYNDFIDTFKKFDKIEKDDRKVIKDLNRQVVFRLATPETLVNYLNEKKPDLSAIKECFLCDLYKNIDSWFGNTDESPILYMSNFFNKLFGEFIDNSIDIFIEHNKSYIEKKANSLYDKSMLQFPFSPNYNSVQSGEVYCTFVRVPKKLDNIFQNTQLTSNQNINYRTSEDKTRISQITFQVNLSLDDYFEFENLKKYTDDNSKGKSSRHYCKGLNVEYGK